MKVLRRAVLRDYFLGIVVMLGLLYLHSTLEASWIGQPLRDYWFGITEHLFVERHVPIVVYDIHDIRQMAPAKGALFLRTPRDRLKELIESIARLGPSAIGIDIDMSPEGGGLQPEDRDFYEFVLQESKNFGVPIFLGVYRSAPLPSDLWLHSSKYQPVGATIVLPEDPTYLLATLADETGDFKPTFALNLAAALQEKARSRRDIESFYQGIGQAGFGRLIFREIAEVCRGGGVLSGAAFLVDYSQLGNIERRAVEVDAERGGRLQPIAINPTLAGEVAIIGDASPQSDPVFVPVKRAVYSGVMVHASGVYTLAEHPLYELTSSMRFALDALATLIALGVVALLRLYYVSRRGIRFKHEVLKPVLSWILALTWFGCCVLLVRAFSIVWDDFILVAVLLVFHPIAEEWFERLARGSRWAAPAIWNALFIERRGQRVRK